MQKKEFLFKFLVFLFVFILLNVLFSPTSSASNITLKDIIDKGENWVSDPVDTHGFDTGALQKTSNDVYNIFLIIGICIAVLIGIFLGILWMISSVEDKAEIKKALIPYIVGCIVIFGAFTIWKVIVDFGQTL